MVSQEQRAPRSDCSPPASIFGKPDRERVTALLDSVGKYSDWQRDTVQRWVARIAAP